MSDSPREPQDAEKPIRREHDSVDDFEHLEHDLQEPRGPAEPRKDPLLEREAAQEETRSQEGQVEPGDPKKASLLLVEAERSGGDAGKPKDDPEPAKEAPQAKEEREETPREEERDREVEEIRSSVLPAPEKSPTVDFLGDVTSRKVVDDSWDVVPPPPTPCRLNADPEDPEKSREVERTDKMEEAEKMEKVEKIEKIEASEAIEKLEKAENLEEKKKKIEKVEEKAERAAEKADSGGFSDALNVVSEPKFGFEASGSEAGDSSEFEWEAEQQSPAKTAKTRAKEPERTRIEEARGHGRVEDVEIAPKEIFRSLGIDAWFNPERLDPKVAALIYWRNPETSGCVFGAILGVLLSLAYFSLISVLAYLSLLALSGTVAFRIYKTVLQAVQKTSDGHPFKDILELDLTLPAEKVHEVADVAVAHANAAVSELRRLFLVEDFVDSLKFGVLLWCLTYVGSWFNGMTLIIIGVVALFTLPKIYETNKDQIDENIAFVQGKVNEITAKAKMMVLLGKKPEPTKEE